MHIEAQNYITQLLYGEHFGSVVEFGSRNVNGSIRDFVSCDSYIGIDLIPGQGVNVIADAANFALTQQVDLVICAEMLEHTPSAQAIIDNALKLLKPCGRCIITCAGPVRAPHSAIDGCAVRPGEYYKGIDAGELTTLMRNFIHCEVIDRQGIDTYALGVKECLL